MSRSPAITISSEELRQQVEDHLDRFVPDPIWEEAEPYARHKLALYQERYPEVDHYDNSYLVLLTADVVRETEFSAYTLAAFRSATAGSPSCSSPSP